MKIFFEHPWLSVLGLGVPFLAIMLRLHWRAAQHSVWRRLFLCATFASVFTILPFSVSTGHSGSTFIAPAAWLVLAGATEWPSPYSLAMSAYGFVPICIVALIALGIWSAVLRKKKGPHNAA